MAIVGEGKGKLPYMLSVRLTEATYRALVELAEEEERPSSQLVRLLVKEALVARGALKPEGKKKR